MVKVCNIDTFPMGGRVFVGRAGLAAFSAAARAFEGLDVAEIGGPQANPESLISFSAAAVTPGLNIDSDFTIYLCLILTGQSANIH